MFIPHFHFSLVQLLSHVQLFATPGTAAHQASLSIINLQSLLKLMMMPSNHLILCHPLLLLSSVFPSIRVFSNESVLCTRWPKYWRVNVIISPSNEYSELISFKIDWLDLLAVPGVLKSLLKHHRSKASILWLLNSQLKTINSFKILHFKYMQTEIQTAWRYQSHIQTQPDLFSLRYSGVSCLSTIHHL